MCQALFAPKQKTQIGKKKKTEVELFLTGSSMEDITNNNQPYN